MSPWSIHLLALLALNAEPLTPGDHTRTLKHEDLTRSFVVHVPKSYDAKKPTPVVLALHGAGMNAGMMVPFCGLNPKSDEAGFIVVYPNGTGTNGVFLTWNAGGALGPLVKNKADDVGFINKVLDDVATIANVDKKRIYATGMSNGGMMAYRLAAEMPDRIAAIAPVAGNMLVEEGKQKRPVPVMHFHGTDDSLVPFTAKNRKPNSRFRSAEESVSLWAKLNGCPDTPTVTEMPNEAKDKLKVTRKVWGPGKEGSEVVLYVIDGGGHTWPGRDLPLQIVGKSTKNISATDLLWEFFQKHPMK